MKTVLILFFIVVVEFLLEAYIAKKYYKTKGWLYNIIKKHHFSFIKYLIFFGVPFATVMFVVLEYNSDALPVFLLFAVIGTFMEWLIGFAYENVMGKRLWTYNKFNINKYTSYLSIPLWGIAGVVFWLAVNVL